MALSVRYSLRAKQEEIELLEYVLEKFGQKSAKEVFDTIEKVLESVRNIPEMYPASKKQKGLRKCVFSKQTSIYYRVRADCIEVVSFRPNRKNPKKFKV